MKESDHFDLPLLYNKGEKEKKYLVKNRMSLQFLFVKREPPQKLVVQNAAKSETATRQLSILVVCDYKSSILLCLVTNVGNFPPQLSRKNETLICSLARLF